MIPRGLRINAGGQPVSYGWHFSHNADLEWISFGFTHSLTAPFIGGTHGPLASHSPSLSNRNRRLRLDVLRLAVLGGALTLGIGMRIAG